jgi:hypothetical protein
VPPWRVRPATPVVGTTPAGTARPNSCVSRSSRGAWAPHPALAPLFVDYLATRLPLREQALFVGVQGKRLRNTQLSQIFRHYVDASGIGERKRVTPHTLRHVFASELLRAGANLRQIQELLGHKHLDSTQHYTRVTAHELRGAVKRLRWVGAPPPTILAIPPVGSGMGAERAQRPLGDAAGRTILDFERQTG